MNILSAVPGYPATTPSLDHSACILAAGELLLLRLEQGHPISAAQLRHAMETAFGASDATGAWNWKLAYEACETATVLFLRKYGTALFRKAATPTARLAALTKILGLLPTHTRRSEESQALQQFSTPVPLGLAALTAAAIKPGDRVLEPSAGTGLLAILAQLAGGSLTLNELADARAGLLAMLFPTTPVTRFDAAQINDHLDAAIAPSVVVMNPPFSAMAHVAGRVQDAGFRHISSALRRLVPGGRLVAITGANVGPDIPQWRQDFVSLQEHARVVFSCAIAGAVYARHGTTFPTRLTVIDKSPAIDPNVFPPSPGNAPDVATLLGWIAAQVPPRLPVTLPETRAQITVIPTSVRGYLARTTSKSPSGSIVAAPESRDLAYETVDWSPPEDTRMSDGLYEGYALQSICIPGSQPHPTKLVQSAAMASVAPPKPSYRPRLPVTGRSYHADGQDLVIARDYIKEGMRDRARDLITQELGPRTDLDIRRSLERQIGAERWIQIDRQLMRDGRRSGVIDVAPLPGGEPDPFQTLKVGRLRKLETLGLATQIGPGQWTMDDKAEATLREIGERGDIIKRMHRSLTERGIERASSSYVLAAEQLDQPVVGRLVARGLDDELRGSAFAVVDGLDGRTHHIRLSDLDAAGDSAPGSIVELRSFDDARGIRRAALAVRSDLDIDRQVTASGATWLDRQAIARAPSLMSESGFGGEVREALDRRAKHLMKQGLAEQRGTQVSFARNLIETLRRQEVAAVGDKLAAETGKPFNQAGSGEYVAGTYRQRLTLASGRFAMLDDGLGFQLVPWTPALEKHLGRHVSGVARTDGGIDWSFARKRGLGL